MSGDWPRALWLIRHGESVGNVAADAAHAAGQERIDIAERDADVGLTPHGEDQARAVGAYLAAMPEARRPTRVLCSPYRRAQLTASLALDQAASRARLPIALDERLRDRELGALEHLTHEGIVARYPEEAEALQRTGRFYYRPPRGESWVDVALRLRGVTSTLRQDHAGERVAVFAHDVIVLLFRYLLEGLDEATLLRLDHNGRVDNGSVTCYEWDERQGLALRYFNAVLSPEGEVAESSSEAR